MDETTAAPETPSGGILGKVEESRRAHSIWVTGARIGAALFAMVIPIVLVRVLDQSTFGLYKELFLVALTLTAVLELGIPASLYYFVPRARDRSQRFFVQSTVILTVLGIVGGGALLLFQGELANLFDAPLEPYAPWIALYIALALPAALLTVAPNVDRRARLAALAVTGSDLFRGVLLVAVALWTGELLPVVIASCAAVGLQALGVVAYLIWRGRHTDQWAEESPVGEQLAYALPFAGAATVGLVRDKLHSYFVAASFGTAQFAIYAVASLRLPFIGKLTQTVGEVMILDNADNFKEGRLGEMRRIWYRATYGLALVMFFIFALAEVYATEAIVLFFGSDYVEAAPIFRVFMSTLPLSVLLASPMLRATGDLKVMLVADVLSLAAAVGALLLLAGPLGPLGAALSLVAGRIAFAGVAAHRILRRLEVSLAKFLPWLRLGKVMGVALAACLLSTAIFSEAHYVVRLFGGSSLAVLLYAASVWWGGLLPEAEREMVIELVTRVTTRIRQSLAADPAE